MYSPPKKHFFQSPLNTSYGQIIHYRIFNYKNIFAHFCTCGAKPIVKQVNHETHVSCKCNKSHCVSHANEQVAINLWNASAFSQFPSRISVVPFKVDANMRFNPVDLANGAKEELNNLLDKDDQVLVSALEYVIAWCHWLSTDFDILSKSEMEREQATFHRSFRQQCRDKMNAAQISMLNSYIEIHKLVDPDKRFYLFVHNYCKHIFDSVIKNLPHPTKVKKKLIKGELTNA